MYHFLPAQPAEPVRLSFRAVIAGHTRQYLKKFQVEAIQFMHQYLSKGEFCIYNDESGLGKQASVAVLLDAACSNKKCLIVVQNDDQFVTGWQFHFSVLAKLGVVVINDNKDTTDTPHSVYIAKWSTLRSIDDLSKFKFDIVIVDNRGQLLNNSFCTSMLLKHFEKKINILISSVDITSDLKLLHNTLRLGGRLEPQYNSFKVFEEKFKLPDPRELAYKKVDLEEYFQKRERLADYCKNFRLRRYCHQYEQDLPLVPKDRYKINLDLWREKQNATASESSSVEFLSQQKQNANAQPQQKSTQELFEDYCRKNRKKLQEKHKEFERELQERNELEMQRNREDDEVASINATSQNLINTNTIIIPATPPLGTSAANQQSRENSDEGILMSPLLVESESDAEDVPEICNDAVEQIEIFDLSLDDVVFNETNRESEEKNKETESNKDNKQTKAVTDKQNKTVQDKENKKVAASKKRGRSIELSRLEEDIVDNLKIIGGAANSSQRRTRHSSEKIMVKGKKKLQSQKVQAKTVRSRSNEKLNLNKKLTEVSNTNTKTASTPANKNTTAKCKESPSSDKKVKSPNKTSAISTTAAAASNKNKANQNLKNKLETASSAIKPESKALASSKQSELNRILLNIKKEPIENSEDLESYKKYVKALTEKRPRRRTDITPAGVHHKETRSMQRLTRLAEKTTRCKYRTKNLALQIDKVASPNNKQSQKKKISSEPAAKVIKRENKTTQQKEQQQIAKEKQIKEAAIKNTQASILSHTQSDFETLQCAQRLSGDAGIYNNKPVEFLVPQTPLRYSNNSLIPSSMTSSTAGFFGDSEVIFVPPTSTAAAAKKTAADQQIVSLSSSDTETSQSLSNSSTSRRTRALKPRRALQQSVANSTESNKMPSFSELLAKQNARSKNKSPDLFSNCSDLGQITLSQVQMNSEQEPNTPFEGFKIFGSEVKQLQQHYALKKPTTDLSSDTNTVSKKKRKTYEDRSCLDILEKMFEPPAKKQKTSSSVSSTQKQASSSNTNDKTANRKKQFSKTQPAPQPILPAHPIEAITEAQIQQELQRKKKRTTTSTLSTSTIQDDDEIFEITNNGTFGSLIRLHSNGEISPVQQTQKSTQQQQHNKITNYLIGGGGSGGGAANNSSQEEQTIMEAGTPISTPNKRLIVSLNGNIKRSPKGKLASTQATKLTKWFVRPATESSVAATVQHKESNEKTHKDQTVKTSRESSTKVRTPTKNNRKQSLKQQQQQEPTTTADSDVVLILSDTDIAGAAGIAKRQIKRRRLDLTGKK